MQHTEESTCWPSPTPSLYRSMILSPSPESVENEHSTSPASSPPSSSATPPALANFFAQASILLGHNPLLHPAAKAVSFANTKPPSIRHLRSLNIKNHEDLLRFSTNHSSAEIVDLVKAIDRNSPITEQMVSSRTSEALGLVAEKRGWAREVLNRVWAETGWKWRGRAFDVVEMEEEDGGCVECAMSDNGDGERNRQRAAEAGSISRRNAVEKVLAWTEMEAEPGQEVLIEEEATARRKTASKQGLRGLFSDHTGDWPSDSSSSSSDAETEDWMDSPPDRAPYGRRLLKEPTRPHPVAAMKKAAAGRMALHAHKAKSLAGRLVSEEEDAALILLNLRDECSEVLRVRKSGMREEAHE